ncbi:MAG: glycosyltransferase family 4 protein [Candidatus Helarchaeota archaeon]
MRILKVMHGFPPEYMAGSEVYSLHLALELNKKHEVIVFHRIENPFLDEYSLNMKEFQGLTKYVLNIPYLPHYFEGRYINEKVDEIFTQFLDKIKPDIVHFGHLNYLSSNLVKITKTKNIPTIFTLHDFWLFCPRGQLINRRDESLCDEIIISKCKSCLDEYLAKEEDAESQIKSRLNHVKNNLLPYVDYFISPSIFLLNKLVSFGIPKEKIDYLDYGFNFDYVKNYTKKKSNKIRFGYIGRITTTKGLHLIIDAFNQIKNENVELRIHGTSSQLDYLKDRAKNQNIHFYGAYDNWDIANVLSEIDVLIVPSTWFENSPLVIHEAAMVKIPVITTNIGGMAEYVNHRVNGLLFKRNDVSDLKAKIMDFVNNPDLIIQLGENQIKVQSITEHVQEVEKFYSKILRGDSND